MRSATGWSSVRLKATVWSEGDHTAPAAGWVTTTVGVKGVSVVKEKGLGAPRLGSTKMPSTSRQSLTVTVYTVFASSGDGWVTFTAVFNGPFQAREVATDGLKVMLQGVVASW